MGGYGGCTDYDNGIGFPASRSPQNFFLGEKHMATQIPCAIEKLDDRFIRVVLRSPIPAEGVVSTRIELDAHGHVIGASVTVSDVPDGCVA